MMCYRIGKEKRTAFRGHPVERSYGKVVVISLPECKLIFEIRGAEEFMEGIELFIFFPVAAFDLAIMPWCIRAD